MLSFKCSRIGFVFILVVGVTLGWLCNDSEIDAQSQLAKPNIQKKWTFRLPDGTRIGKPVCVGDTVYMNTFNDRLIALDCSNGRLRWTFDPGTGKKYMELKTAETASHRAFNRGNNPPGVLGIDIQDLNEVLGKSFGTPDTSGALVSKVKEGTPAQRAGLKEGDVILSFDYARSWAPCI